MTIIHIIIFYYTCLQNHDNKVKNNTKCSGGNTLIVGQKVISVQLAMKCKSERSDLTGNFDGHYLKYLMVHHF